MGKVLKSKMATWVEVTGLALVLSIVVWFLVKPSTDDRTGITMNKLSGEESVVIAVNTWGGFAGGQYWNGGFKANRDKSKFYLNDKLLVEFKLIETFKEASEMLNAGEVDLIWSTVDISPTSIVNLPDDIEIFFQTDWSRGGDAIVVRPGINTVKDLKRKKIAVSLLTPSHTLLINLLSDSGLTLEDIEIVVTDNAMDAAKMFKSGDVDAAVVWSPDDQDCLDAVKGSKVLSSTKTATHIIADVIVGKRQYLKDNQKMLTKLYDGWMLGSAEINTSESAKKEAVAILVENFKLDDAFCLSAINNARLTTHGDNVNFFGLNKTYRGVTGENVWNKSSIIYSKLGFVTKKMDWRNVSTTAIISASTLTGKPNQEAEAEKQFSTPTKEMGDDSKVVAVSSKSASIEFNTGQYELSYDAMAIINREFVDIAKINTSARIRIVGNTDNTGSYATNVSLSAKRAQAVANYLINEHGINSNRLIIVGDGPRKAVEDGVVGANEKYRVTNFELIIE